jgi:hypothetical protein
MSFYDGKKSLGPDPRNRYTSYICTVLVGGYSMVTDPVPYLLTPEKNDRARVDLVQYSNKFVSAPAPTFFDKKVSCLLLFEVTFLSFYKDKKSRRSHKRVGIKVFLTVFV